MKPSYDYELCKEVQAHVNLLYRNLPASDMRIKEIKQLQEQDEVCQQLTTYCQNGWPIKTSIPGNLKPYLSVSGEIQSNGEAERAVRTIKSLLKKAEDPYVALLEYRSTPVTCGYSPAELLMNRKLRSSVPIPPVKLQPSIPDYAQLKKKDEMKTKQQEENFNVHHRAKELTPLNTGDTVWITDQQTEGTVVQSSGQRSYQVETPSGMIHRNRRHLNPLGSTTTSEPEEISSQPEEISNQPEETNGQLELNSQPSTEQKHTRSGRVSVRPTRLIEDTDWR